MAQQGATLQSYNNELVKCDCFLSDSKLTFLRHISDTLIEIRVCSYFDYRGSGVNFGRVQSECDNSLSDVGPRSRAVF